MATTPYDVGSGGSASTSVLTFNVTTSTSNGDCITVGVTINTANAIPSVTDSQGNTYTGVLDSVTETGAQLWTFEAPGAAALSSTIPDTITVTVVAP
jgi:hypothetical protein